MLKFLIKVCKMGLFSLISITSLQAQEIDYKGFPEWSWQQQDSTEYYLYTPKEMQAGKKYPLVLFLHGCCGPNNQATLRNTVDPPVRMWHNFGANTQAVPTYIVAPATQRGWSQHISNLKNVIDSLIANGNADPQRLYITGFSMGGRGTWEFLNRYPEYFAAALPMGMEFSGDPEKIKDIPIWTIKGETDYWGRNLNKSVDQIRALNGYALDTSAVWETGVNPRLTVFEGMGHGVQWPAASKLDLTTWAYAKVNDGNKYPVVYFSSPSYKQSHKGKTVPVHIEANDPDGEISRVEVFVNGKSVKVLTDRPFKTTIKMDKGDATIEAKAFDDKGKYSITTTVVRTDIPAAIKSSKLPEAQQGTYYSTTIQSEGNGQLLFSLSDSSLIPTGMVLSSKGELTGIPVQTGLFTLPILVKDEDNDKTSRTLNLVIREKEAGSVLVTEVKNYAGKVFPVTIVKKGLKVHGDREDDEITLSETSRYEGLTLIQTDVNDTINAEAHYLEFTTDEDVTVYIAYEKKDKLHYSTVPAWLKEYKKENVPQIVTQYYYYDVYSRDFPKGRIILPDAQEKSNGVSTNYFVMVKKKSE